MAHAKFHSAGLNPRAKSKQFVIFGQPVRVLLHSDQSEAGCFCFEQITPPSLGVPPHTHAREDEVVHILEGTFEIHLGGKSFQATAGDTVNFARGTAHGFTNIGTTNGRTIWVVTPGAAFEDFFDTVSKFPPGPPDFEKLDALHVEIGVEMPRPKA